MLQVQFLSQDYVREKLGRQPHDQDGIAKSYNKIAGVLNPKRDITNSVLTNKMVDSWQSSASSQLLLVVPPDLTDEVIPAEYTAANLYGSLSKERSAVTIGFFIIKYLARSDEEPVTRLLRSLLLQLLNALEYGLTDWKKDTSFQNHRDCLQSRDLGYLCSLFQHLANSSPRAVVFCLIHNVRLLDAIASDESFDALFHMFEDLVRTCNEQDSVRFKIMLLTPNKGDRLLSRVQASNTVQISKVEQSDISTTN